MSVTIIREIPKVYIEAYACSEYASVSPDYAYFLATLEFLADLKRLACLCVDHQLSELRVYASPDAWGPGDVESEMRLTCAELVVTKNSFWFVDQPKNAEYHIESRAQSIADFCKKVEDSEPGQMLIFGENETAIAELIADESRNESVAERS